MNALEIGVGTAVIFDSGNKYRVLEVKIKNNKTYPHKIAVISSPNRNLGDIIEDKYGDWWQYNWRILAGGVAVDPKARVIAKIRYLDEKFKAAQALKKQATVSITPTSMDDPFIGVWNEAIISRSSNLSWAEPNIDRPILNERLREQTETLRRLEIQARALRASTVTTTVPPRPWAINPYSGRRG
jgi:hypothetical protein